MICYKIEMFPKDVNWSSVVYTIDPEILIDLLRLTGEYEFQNHGPGEWCMSCICDRSHQGVCCCEAF